MSTEKDEDKQVLVVKQTSSSSVKVVYYPVAGSKNGGSVHLIGSTSAKNIAIMSAGYPDDHECMIPFATKLSQETDTFVGVTCLPGYDDREDHPWTEYKKEGFTFDEMGNAFFEAWKVVEKHSTYDEKEKKKNNNNNDEVKVIGIFHDWAVPIGCMFANRFRELHPTTRKLELILFDVLTNPHPDMGKNVPNVSPYTGYETFVGLSYRAMFASFYFIQRFSFPFLAKILFVPMMTFLHIFRLSPILSIDSKVLNNRSKPIAIDRSMYMAYPYVNLFQAMKDPDVVKNGIKGMSLPKDLKNTPVLYMYGLNKRINFHDHRSLQLLQREHEQKSSKSKVIQMDNAGHWFYTKHQQLDETVEKVKEFMEAD